MGAITQVVPHVIPHRVHINGSDAGEIQLRVRGASGQTANILEAQNSAGTTLFSIDASGNMTIAGSISAVVSETITGNIDLTGNLTVNGNTTLGNVSSDTITFVGTPTFQTAISLTQALTSTSSITSATLAVTGSATVGTNLVVGATTSTQGLTVTGTATFLGAVNFPSGLQITNDDNLIFGTTNAAGTATLMQYDTAETVDCFKVGVDETSRRVMIMDYGDINTNSALSAATNPTLSIFAATYDANDRIDFYHTGTAGVINVGSGAAAFDVLTNGSTFVSFNTNGTFLMYGGSSGYSNWQTGGSNVGLQFRNLLTTSTTNAGYNFINDASGSTGNSASSGTQVFANFDAKVNQSGTAGMIGLRVKNIETSLGSGTSYIFQGLAGTTGATEMFSIRNTGDTAITQAAVSAGRIAFTLTGGAHTAVVAESITHSHAAQTITITGAYATQRFVNIAQPTISAASALTVTTASTVDFNAAPTVASSAVITNANILNMGGAVTMAGAASATYSGINIDAHTVTDSTTTQITSACFAAGVRVGQITVAQSGGAVTVDAAASLYINAAPTAGASVTLTNAYALWIDAGAARFDGRILGTQGADVASATNLTLGTDGNAFELTGTTKVDLISNVGWQEGSIITLIANESVTIDSGTATSGTNVQILLAGGAGTDFAMTANDTLTLMLCSTTAGGQAWREVSRSAI